MIDLEGWWAIPFGLVLLAAVVLLAIWWRQQTYRWALMVLIVLVVAPALSLWSAHAFEVPDYRAGCDGLCHGFRGAPIPTYRSSGLSYDFLLIGFSLNTLAYAVLFLGWGALIRAILVRLRESPRRSALEQVLVTLILLVAPLALSPLFLPAPEARVRGDSLRVAINAGREVYMYDHDAPMPLLHMALNDVRPRPDGQPGMRVCMRSYTFFYLPAGYLYLDMTREGVHSNNGGFLPLTGSCWPSEEESHDIS